MLGERDEGENRIQNYSDYKVSILIIESGDGYEGIRGQRIIFKFF